MSENLTIGATLGVGFGNPAQPAKPKAGLAALLHDRSTEEFYRDFWPDKALYFFAKGGLEQLPPFLLDRSKLEIAALAARGAGAAWVSNAAKASHQMRIDRRAAEYAYQMGLTVYLDDVMPALPGAAAFCRKLEADLGLPENAIRLTAWGSPLACGAACHYDNDDVISVQIRGTKRFELAPVAGLAHPVGRPYSGGSRLVDETYPQMTEGFPEIDESAFESVEMTPGSVLIFQRGTWHRTFADSDSLSLSFVLEAPPAVDCVLKQLRDVLSQDPKWRRPLYGAWGNPEQRAEAEAALAELLADLPRQAQAISPAHVIASRQTETQRLADLGPESRFQRIPNASATERAGDGNQVDANILWRLEDGTLELQATLSAPKLGMEAIAWMAARAAPFTMAEIAAQFPAIPEAGLTRLLASCTEHRLIKPLWYPAAP